MKTIMRQFFNQEPVTDSGYIDIDRLFNAVRNHPAFFVWGIWTIYLGFDVLTRFTSGLSFAAFKIIVLNYLAGGLFHQYWFFVYLPNLLYLRKWKLISALFLLLFIVFISIKFLLIDTSGFQTDIRSLVVKEFVRIFHFLIYTTAFWGLIEGVKREIEKNKLEVDFEKLQINHLSLQLSPHFVINVLSNYLASILLLSKPLYQDISLFSNLLSYSYKDPQLPNFLDEEVGAIEEYVLCQRGRFKSKLKFHFSKNFDRSVCKKLPIPKWTLMNFVENMFKHGNCFNQELPCLLSMKLALNSNKKQFFTFILTNGIELSPPPKSTHFGIAAVDRVLRYHFLDHYQLFISKSETEFSVFIYLEYEGKFTDRVA